MSEGFLVSKGDNRVISHIFQKVDRTLLNKDDISVINLRFGPIAMTDNKRIHINFDKVKEVAKGDELTYFVIIKTLNLHELAHIWITDYDYKQVLDISRKKDFFRFLNAFEDARIETAFSQKWRASEKYFKYTFGKVVLDTILEDMKLGTPKGYAGMFARIYGTKFVYHAEEFAEIINAYEKMMIETFGTDMLNKMKKLIDEYLTTENTEERIKKAFEVYEMIKDVRDCGLKSDFGDYGTKGKKKDNREVSEELKELLGELISKGLAKRLEEEDFDSRDFEDVYDDIEDEITLSDVADDFNEEDAIASDTDEEIKEGSGDGIGIEKVKSKGKEIGDSDKIKEMKQKITSAVGKSIEILSERLERDISLKDDIRSMREVYDEIEAKRKELKDYIGKRKAGEGYKFNEPIDVVRMIKDTKRELSKIKNDLGFSISRNNKTGKFNLTSFIVKRNSNSWNKVFDKRKMNTHNRCKLAVSLLIDASGSVGHHSYKTQLKGVYVIAKSLEDTKNHCEVVEFSGDIGTRLISNPENTYKIIKGFNDICFNGDWKRHFGSGNWLCPALSHSFNNLRILNKQGFGSRFVIVVTDGRLEDDGNTEKQMKKAVKEMQKEGIKVFQFCVGRDAYMYDFFDKSIYVSGYSELEWKIKELITAIQKQVAIQTKDKFR
jgi:hypothetical protein